MTGRRVPPITLRTRVRDERCAPNPFRWDPTSTDELFGAGTHVVFFLPAAFSPTCSDHHLPAVDAAYDELREAGADEVWGVAVNDAFVVYRWGQHLGLKNVRLLPDGNGDLARHLGILVSARPYGYGHRAWRSVAVMVDGTVRTLIEEPGRADDLPTDEDPYGATSPDHVLDWLRRQDTETRDHSEEAAA